MDIKRRAHFLMVDMTGAVRIRGLAKTPLICYYDGQSHIVIAAKIIENPYISLLSRMSLRESTALRDEFFKDIKVNRRLFDAIVLFCKANFVLNCNAMSGICIIQVIPNDASAATEGGSRTMATTGQGSMSTKRFQVGYRHAIRRIRSLATTRVREGFH